MKLLKYNDFCKLNENSEFNQYQFGLDSQMYNSQPLGPGYGFAMDPSLSIYSDDNRPFQDYYGKCAGTTSKLLMLTKQATKDIFQDPVFARRMDRFLEDKDNFKTFKILRIFQNSVLKLDVYISFNFDDTEFFGVYKNFNGLNRPPTLDSELFTNPKYSYIDKEYFLKFNNWVYKKLTNWFIPKPGLYKNMKKDHPIKNEMGELKFLKEGKTVEVMGYNLDEMNDPFITLKIDGREFYIEKNDYYYFHWRFENLEEKKKERNKIE